MSLRADALAHLAQALSGRLLLPSDAAFDDARRIHNGFVDRHPAVIAQCLGAVDVSDVLGLARTNGLDVAVRGGGHNVAGHATIDAGVMIDLSLLRSVTVDPDARMAVVGGGATWKDVNRETQAFGLGMTGGVISSTGVAGLTLGGGFGWLMPKHGMALDHLRAATVVLADGRIVRASASSHPDLFWAIRGGGGNFGVVTSFEFTLHPVGPLVTGGMVAHPLPRASETLRFYRDRMLDAAPDDVFVISALATAPDGSGAKIHAMAGVHVGPVADGEAYFSAFKAFGPPVLDLIGPMPFVVANSMMDPTFISGSRNYWKSHFLPELSDAALDMLVDHFASAPSPQTAIILEHFHGAATRVPTETTAFTLRDEGFNVLLLAQWLDPVDDERAIAWCRSGYEKLRTFGGPRRYTNYLDADDRSSAVLDAAYGPNLPRLRTIKKTYDPTNVFRHNLNIPPAQ